MRLKDANAIRHAVVRTVHMGEKNMRFGPLGGAMDPLSWLKNELQREAAEGEVPAVELIGELDKLADQLNEAKPLQAPRVHDQALEAVLEMLPSESLTDGFLASVER